MWDPLRVGTPVAVESGVVPLEREGVVVRRSYRRSRDAFGDVTTSTVERMEPASLSVPPATALHVRCVRN